MTHHIQIVDDEDDVRLIPEIYSRAEDTESATPATARMRSSCWRQPMKPSIQT